jgi:septum formation protein
VAEGWSAAGTVTTVPPRLVLASASPRRAELLGRLGARAHVRPTAVDETPLDGEAPASLVARLADAKAAACTVAGDAVVLAADTVVVLDDQALGKPRDGEDAREMLRALSGRDHQVLTGVAVRRGDTHRREVVTTDVRFAQLTEAEIAWYVGTGEPAGKAGGYGLQGAGAALVERIEGSDTNVIGLPLPTTVALLRQVGLDLLSPTELEPTELER